MRATWALLFIAVLCTAASADKVKTLDGSQDWWEWDIRSDGVAEITTDQPRSGNGSLCLSTTGTPDKAGAGTFRTDATGDLVALGTLGDLVAGTLSFDWFRDSSTTAAGHLIPALQLHIVTDKKSGGVQVIQMVWEGVYNGHSNPVTEDSWVEEDVTSDNFWLWVNGVGGVYDYDESIEDWYGYNGNGAFVALSADTEVMAVSTGIGSGWSGGYLSYVDNILADFDGGNSIHANFEVVPLPAAAWLGVGMLGVLGLARRIRRRR